MLTNVYVWWFLLGFKWALAWEIIPANLLGKSSECGEIYFSEGFKGDKMSIRDGQRFPDFQGVYPSTELEGSDVRTNDVSENLDNALRETNTNSTSFSFKVVKGCELVASSLAFLKGERFIFTEDVDEVTEDWLVPRSFSCECPQICECEDIHLRKSECGRAYVIEDCTKCKATFSALKKSVSSGGWTDFPSVWSSQLTSIVLREGCNVSLQFSRFEGPDQTIFAEHKVTKNVFNHGRLERYNCQCDDTAYQPRKIQGANSDYPTPVAVPRTKGAINVLLSGRKDLNEHPGLIAALQSLRSRRSSRNAYILLLGMTGSGKSSAVNLLFDHPNITKVGDFVSTTKDIIEFKIPVPIPSMGLNASALHVVDTPGIGDTDGLAQDARFLATLDQFLSSHTDLRRSLPNVVLIFYNFNSNRFNGEGSSFVKMLRTIDLFKDKLIDPKSTNVIFVLTHFMSATKEITRDPSRAVAAFRSVIQEYTSLPRPIHIVLAENKPEEHHLLNVNGFWQLPNNDYYPKNLFDQMERSMDLCKDPLGQAIVQAGFSNSDDFKITGKRYPLLDTSHEKVTNYLGLLGALYKPAVQTEVSRALQEAYDGMDSQLKAHYPRELNSLQKMFYSKALWHLDDLPKTAIGKMKLLEQIQLNPMTQRLLQTAFNITPPEFPNHLLVGYGYSLLDDKPLPTRVLEATEFFLNDDLLFKFPKMYTIGVDNSIDNQFQVATSKKDYTAKRYESLGLPSDVQILSATNSTNIALVPGFNLISLEGSNETIYWSSLTAVINCLTFVVGLNKEAKLTSDFVTALEQLQPLNDTNLENVNKWKRFFDKYGTHIVVTAFGGGSITITARMTDSSVVIGNDDKFGLLAATLANITHQLGNELIGKDGRFKAPEGVHYEFSQRGGSSKHYWTNFTDLDEIKNVQLWRESLKYEPVVLPNRLQVIPISKLAILHKIGNGNQLEEWIEVAANRLLNASLKYVGVDRINNHGPDSRDRTGRPDSDYQRMQQFSMMFQMISETNQNSQKDLMKFMADAEQRNRDAEQEWQQKLMISRQEAARRERELAEEERHEQEMQLKRERLESERKESERYLRLQLEETRRQNELQMVQNIQQKQAERELFMIKFITEENRRRDELIRNRKGFWEKLGSAALSTVTLGFL